ncbi:MAG: hypothetical protein WB762_23810 [Candidatus Sulfotelmatobacter sp.]
MKTARTSLLIALTISIVSLLSIAPTYSEAGDKKPTLSRTELNILLRTAKTPPEHRRIAEYYWQQVEFLTNRSAAHQALATIYEKKPAFPAMESKPGTSFGQAARLCRRWAQLEAEQAKLAEVLATLHEDVATVAEEK